MPKHLPFTWPEFEHEIGRPVLPEHRRRIQAAVNNPTPQTWGRARTIVVAPQMSMMGQTLWQCVNAVTLHEYTAEQHPAQRDIVMAMCYAAGLPYPGGKTW